MDGQIEAAIKQICYEKNLEYDRVLEAIEAALAAAFRKDFGDKNKQNIIAEFNPTTAETKVFDVKTVVEDQELPTEEELAALKVKQEETGEEYKVFNPKTEIMLADAKQIDKKYEIGDEIKTQLEIPAEFGRMAAQTAKQVIIQKLREAERDAIYEEYKKREGALLQGMVHRKDGDTFIIDFGKINGILSPADQIRREFYRIGERLSFYVKSVEKGPKGPELIISRNHPEIIRVLFEREIPEIYNGDIEIKNIAREAGARAKVAVHTDIENLDPIGSCIGQRGARIQTIIGELNGEKIDIIQWDDDAKKYIANAMAPAKITGVELNDEEKLAIVTVPKDQISLAIGRDAQNVRLAVQLTGWAISVREAESGELVDHNDEKAVADSEKAAE
ncbi:MAG TPA: transcription termination factor NusA [bacterium]|nr:transcription termination factor NusA [bacterium]